MSLARLFDYDALDVETRVVVQQKTGEIRERVKRTAQDIIEVGERLIDIKQRLGHGQFGEWLRVEFDWDVRTAQNLMNVASTFKNENFSHLSMGHSAMVALAAPSVPEEARKEAISTANSGHHVGHKEAKRIIENHKSSVTPKSPRPSLFSSSEEDDRQRKRVESRASEPKTEFQDEPEEDDPTSDDEIDFDVIWQSTKQVIMQKFDSLPSDNRAVLVFNLGVLVDQLARQTPGVTLQRNVAMN